MPEPERLEDVAEGRADVGIRSPPQLRIEQLVELIVRPPLRSAPAGAG